MADYLNKFFEKYPKKTNNSYVVKPEDLKGEIADFPIEVVQKMVDYQVEQGNDADISVFQHYKKRGRYNGGFAWENTEEGSNFWCDVICNGLFDRFFENIK